MYAIVIINMMALAYVHFGQEPLALTVYIPAVICGICALRGIAIMRETFDNLPIDKVRRRLNVTVVLAVILGPAIVAWSLALFSYGDAYTKGQVCFFVGITIIAVISCLMPLRQVSVILFAGIVIPACAFLLLQGQAVYTAISLNMLLAVGAMVVVL